MKRLWTLYRLLAKTWPRGELFASKRHNKPSAIAMNKVVRWILAGFLILYFTGVCAALGIAIVETGLAASQPHLFPFVGCFVTSLMIAFSNIFYVVTAYYHNDDLPALLVLPYRAETIVQVKFFQIYIYSLSMVPILIGPAFIYYGIRLGMPLLWWLLLLPHMLLLPALPLSISSILVMLLMRFVPGARNRERFRRVSSIFSFIIIIAVALLPNLLQRGGKGQGDFLSRLISDWDRWMPLVPNAYLAGEGLYMGQSTVNMLLFFLAAFVLAAGSLLLNYGLSIPLYSRMINQVTVGITHKKMTQKHFAKASRQKSVCFSLMRREWWSLLRSPTFLMQCVLGTLVFPLIIIVVLVINFFRKEIPVDLIQMQATKFFHEGASEWLQHVWVLPILLGLSSCSLSPVASTCLSREGRALWIMKVIPVPYVEQVGAKLLVATCLAMVGTVPFLALAIYLCQVPWYSSLLAILLTIIACLLGSVASVYFDLFRPILDWDNEMVPVKNNLNQLWGLIACGVLSAVFVGVEAIWHFLPLPQLFWLGFLRAVLVLAALLALCIFIFLQLTPKRFESLS